METVHLERYPYGHTCALSLVDDTDGSTTDNVGRVYRMLEDYGHRCTKTVWPLRPDPVARQADCTTETLQDPRYTRMCERLHASGFELAMHTASSWSNTREWTLRAYDRFRAVFGHWPLTNVMHGRNRENLYWGIDHLRQRPLWRRMAAVHARFARYGDEPFQGHVPGSRYFWGDICQERTRYVRFFETLDSNTLRFDPATPYHDPDKPFVPWWFSASYGGGHRIPTLLGPSRLEDLAAERGASIVHTYLHLYSDDEGATLPFFEAWARAVAARGDVWVVPVATLLDRLRAIRELQVVAEPNHLTLYNPTRTPVADLALRVSPGVSVVNEAGEVLSASRNRHGQVPLGTLAPGALIQLYLSHTVRYAGHGLSRDPNLDALAFGTAARTAWKHAALAPVRGLRPEVRVAWTS